MPGLSVIRSVCNNLGSAFFDLVFPPICHICKCHLEQPSPLHLCQNCKDSLTPISSPLCSICGTPFAGAGENHPCGHCITSPPAFNAARAAYAYEGSCRDMIHSFKYSGKSLLRRPLALLMEEQLRQFATACRADLIIPVPLHKKRLQTRGFNQAVLLGETLSQIWQLPLLRQGLVRTRPTKPQIDLTHDERRDNMRDAFAVNAAGLVQGKTVLLIDDVYTTGSTLHECSKTLSQSGATAVFAITVAQAPVPH